MSDIYPFDTQQPPEQAQRPPAPIPQVPPQAQGVQQGGLVDKWKSWLSEPANRSAMLQFGAQLMQPVGVGQTGWGQLGTALGEAGEAAGRVKAQDLAEEKVRSDTDLKEAKIQNAQDKLALGTERLGRAGDRLQMQQYLGELRNNTQLLTAYTQHVAKLRAANEIAQSPTPIPTFEEWVGTNPALAGKFSGTGAQPSAGSGGPTPPKVGEVRKGYRFKGGDPKDQNSWEKVGG